MYGVTSMPYKCFAADKTLAEGQFICPEHLDHRRMEAAKGCRNPKEEAPAKKPAAKKANTANRKKNGKAKK